LIAVSPATVADLSARQSGDRKKSNFSCRYFFMPRFIQDCKIKCLDLSRFFHGYILVFLAGRFVSLRARRGRPPCCRAAIFEGRHKTTTTSLLLSPTTARALGFDISFFLTLRCVAIGPRRPFFFRFFFLPFLFPYGPKGNGPSAWWLRARPSRTKRKTGKKKDPPKNFPLAASRQLVGWRLFFSFFLARIEMPTPTEGIESVSRHLPHSFAGVGDTPTASRNCHWPTLFYLFLKKKRNTCAHQRRMAFGRRLLPLAMQDSEKPKSRQEKMEPLHLYFLFNAFFRIVSRVR
jgi:hypothetical protein